MNDFKEKKNTTAIISKLFKYLGKFCMTKWQKNFIRGTDFQEFPYHLFDLGLDPLLLSLNVRLFISHLMSTAQQQNWRATYLVK